MAQIRMDGCTKGTLTAGREICQRRVDSEGEIE